MVCEISKRTRCVGDHLYLIEGMNGWGLYDLSLETMTVVDPESGETLDEISRSALPPDTKRCLLETRRAKLWRNFVKSGLGTRLFEIDTSEDNLNRKGMHLLWVELTDGCNQRCLQCYTESSPSKAVITMPTDLAQRIITEADPFRFAKIQFTGGEPLLHPDLQTLARLARSLHFDEVEIYTNLTLASDETLSWIKQEGVSIATSLLGHNSETHDLCTRLPGSFSRWYERIKKVQAMGIKFRVGIVRLKQNETYIRKIERFVRAEGLIDPGAKFEPDDYRATGKLEDTKLAPDTVASQPYLTVNPGFFHRARRYNPCWWGQVAVSPTGIVYPCVFSRTLPIGDLREKTLTWILEKAANSFWLINLDRVDKCKDCELRYACMDCRALCLNNGRGLYGSQPRCSYGGKTASPTSQMRGGDGMKEEDGPRVGLNQQMLEDLHEKQKLGPGSGLPTDNTIGNQETASCQTRAEIREQSFRETIEWK